MFLVLHNSVKDGADGKAPCGTIVSPGRGARIIPKGFRARSKMNCWIGFLSKRCSFVESSSRPGQLPTEPGRIIEADAHLMSLFQTQEKHGSGYISPPRNTALVRRCLSASNGLDRNVTRIDLDKFDLDNSWPASSERNMKTDIPAPRHMQQAASLVLYNPASKKNDALRCFIQLPPISSALLEKLR